MSDRTADARSYALTTEGNLFEVLRASVRFEDVGKGRQGAVLLKPDEGRIPVVRTTTRYAAPAQCFGHLHEQLAQQIREVASLSSDFNNALIENYTNAYTTMGGHSDQALDLAGESYIAIFSCYQFPDRVNPPRKLRFESKDSNGDGFEILLAANSVVVFSVESNRRYRHKIILDKSPRTPENSWLGITFRMSKTYLRFRDGLPYFLDGERLTLAGDEQRQEFLRLRRRENSEIDFSYPRIGYSLSESDMMPPVASRDAI